MIGNRNWVVAVSVLVAAGLVLGGCSTPTAAPPTEEPTALPTEIPAATETPPAPGPTAMPEVGVPVIETPAPGDPTAIANYNTYIYGGPGKDYAVYGAFLGGASAKVTGVSQDGSWWVVSVPPAPNGIGWVEGVWVTVSGTEGVPVVAAPPVPPTTDMVPPGSSDPQATTLVNTYVRTGPGTTYAAYGVAPAGVTGRVIGKSEDGSYWVVRLDPQKVGAGYGWVGASTVQASNVDGVPVIQAPPPPAQVAPSPPAGGAPSATAFEYVNVRSGAGTCYAVYGVGAPGATAEIAAVSSDGQWWQIKIPASFSPEGLGWVGSSYVVALNADSVPVIQSEACPEVPVPPPAEYACSLESQTPADHTQLSPETVFEITWVVMNTGNEAWTDAVLQFIMSGAGGPLHTGPDSTDIPDGVGAGDTYDANVPALVPTDAWAYGELWQILSGDTAVCEFWVIIDVAE
ncbi:MAG TPA: NBR1-Ig-like domain-containing protein [Anaerolineales bacterium]|nr:NBR1-Ig-like domain-containing protein [Anaerolineales bacterium]